MRVMVPADILLPQTEDMGAWSVIACDQFTSEGEYWDRVVRRVGDEPSTLSMMLPEAWLDTEKSAGADERIRNTMEGYLSSGFFRRVKNSYIYLERTQRDGRIRRGLMAALDLEMYDYRPGAKAPVRATEGTVEERLPPRVKIRRQAPLELPHIMVLMDDEENSVLSAAQNIAYGEEMLYDFDLMEDGGHVTGWQIPAERSQTLQAALEVLSEPTRQRERYGLEMPDCLAFAVGDGNHSLAAAKKFWEGLKATLSAAEREKHPARYALVELCSIHDPALDFEPIHRVIFDTDADAFREEYGVFLFRQMSKNLTAGETIAAAEEFCQAFVQKYGGRIDYIHGEDTVRRLGQLPGSGAMILPPIEKDELFLSVARSGAFPRKSFSMGHAWDKRYYLECRAIR